jgi:hypothetical protein
MRLVSAVNAVATGASVISAVSGKRYTPEMLAPISRGPHWAVCATSGMTRDEYKGTFRIAEVNAV